MLLGSLVKFAVLYSPQTLIGVFSNQFQVSPSTASCIISFATITMAVSMLFVSVFSNAWGRKGMMSVSLFLTSLLTILSAFSHSFPLLLILRLLEGVSLAGFPAIAMTYLNEEISPRSIGRVMGVYVGGTAIGGFVGRIIVSALTDLFSWHVAFFVLGIFSFICSFCFWITLPDSKHFQPVNISFSNWAAGFKSGLTDKKLLFLYGIGFLLLGIYVTLFNYLGYPLSKPPYNLSQTVIGFLFIFQLVGSWSSFLFGKLADRYSRAALIGWGITLLFISALLTLYGNIFFMVIGIILFTFGFFAGHTVASGWVGSVSPAPNRAYASSLYLLFYYTGSSLFGWAGGFFLSFYGWGGVISMICCLLLATALLLSQLTRSTPSRLERSA
jgi:YNFM family putative membrane transporter